MGRRRSLQPLKGTGSDLQMSSFSLWSQNNRWDMSRCEVDRRQPSGKAQIPWKPRVEAVGGEVRGWAGRNQIHTGSEATVIS